jgi:hypothetical protein
MLVLATTSACKDETTAETPPATPPTADGGAREHEPPHGDGDGGEGDGGGGIGFFFTKKRIEPTPPAPHSGGMLGLTRDMIATVRRTDGTPLRLVPDAAQFVARARPAVLLGHPEAKAAWAKAEESDASFKTGMEVVRACLPGLEAFEDVVIGFDDAKHVVLAARAPGLGTDAKWRCFQSETILRGKPFEVTITGTARGEGPQLRSDEGDLGYFPDDDTLVMVSKEWDADVTARLRGEGTAAIEGGLAGVMGRIEPDDPLWLVGRITGMAESGLAGSPMAGIDDVAFDVRIEGDELAFTTSVDAGEAADATRMRDELQRQLDQFKSVLPVMGVPSSVADEIAFVAEGDLVSMRLTMSGDELRSLREGIERTF